MAKLLNSAIMQNLNGTYDIRQLTHQQFPVFTVTNGHVEIGATVRDFHLPGSGVTLQALLVGEEGRGRKLGVLPIEGGVKAGDTVKFASLAEIRSGRAKLIAASEANSEDEAIVVLLNQHGFRGSSSVSNDTDEETPECVQNALCSGIVADGMAGRMAESKQYVILLPKNTIICTRYTGRLYGDPNLHYLRFDGKKLIAVTVEERVLTGCF